MSTAHINNTLRKKIEARFGKSIRYSKDCEALSLSIEHACKERISATTLKRLFGFAKSTEKPRMFTLDVLAAYVGYPDWSSFLSDAEKNQDQVIYNQSLHKTEPEIAADIYDLNHQLLISLTTQNIDTGKIIQLCRQHGKKPEIITFLTELICIAGRLKHMQFLKQVFSLPYIFDERLHEQGAAYYIAQAVGMILRANPDLAYELLETYAASKRAQRYLVEWFVDEDYLQGYYGKLLDRYHYYKKKEVQDRLFYFALKYSQAMQAGDFLSQKDWYKRMAKLRINGELHEILAGRYVGICLAEDCNQPFIASSPYYKLICQYIVGTTYEMAIHFLLYLYRYLFKGKCTEWIKGVLNMYEEKVKSRPDKERSHWGRRAENELFIYLAYAYSLAGNNREAKKMIRSVDPNLFDIFMYRQVYNDYSSISTMLSK
jgi:hypothetical protein